MKKAVWKGISIGALIILLSVLVMYLGLARYYADGFSYGTWINGVYCTGKSVSAINEELLKQRDYNGLTITDSDGKSYVVSAEAIHYRADYEQVLKKYLERQNPYLWIDNLIAGHGKHRIEPLQTYDQEAYEKTLRSLPFLRGEGEQERRVMVLKGNMGYYLVNERNHVLNVERTKEAIRSAILEERETLDLEQEGLYEDLPLTVEQEQELALWEKLESYQDCGIVYVLGEERVPVDSGVVCDWVALDENGKCMLDDRGELITDEEKIGEFVERLAEEYDTVGKSRQFQATRGDIVTVEGGIYGNQIDREAEKEYLTAAFYERRREEHEPAYTQMARRQGKDDIGDTYIEVDMTNQMLYYYVDGKLEIETPVVTGNTSLHRGTPSGTNYVYSKQRDRILRGEDYASPVKYWMPVYRAIGIHDSSWRRTYGGTIYKTDGSHGCINTPLKEVTKLYEMVELGTPCIMFY